MNNILIIAPHPDDETLGCGGTILKYIKSGCKVYLVIVTSMTEDSGFSKEKIKKRELEIKEAADKYKFSEVFKLGFPAAKLDRVPFSSIVKEISKSIKKTKCEIMYIPNYGDIHSDHRITSEAAMSCSKWFRYNTVKKIYAYETLSETEFGINNCIHGFRPNVFVNIEDFLEEKLKIMNIFKSELGEAPFPRSNESVRGLSQFRGTASGYKNAEAFMLLRERVD